MLESFAEQVNKSSTKLCLRKPRILKQGGSAQRADMSRRFRRREAGRGSNRHQLGTRSVPTATESFTYTLILIPPTTHVGVTLLPIFYSGTLDSEWSKIGIQDSPLLPEMPTQTLDFTTTDSKNFFIHPDLNK